MANEPHNVLSRWCFVPDSEVRRIKEIIRAKFFKRYNKHLPLFFLVEAYDMERCRCLEGTGDKASFHIYLSDKHSEPVASGKVDLENGIVFLTPDNMVVL